MGLTAQISKTLGGFTLNIDLTCAPGKIVTLVGPTGAGKTTILRILAGLERPDAGRITFGSQTWVDTERKIFIPPQGRRLGYVFQDYPLFPHLNVHANVALAAPDKALVERLLKSFGLWELRQRKPERLSGGERQRAAICQALARQPQVLLLDEPFSALDILTRRTLREVLRSLRQTLDIPIVHITHDIDEALCLASEILPIVRGRVERKWLFGLLMHPRSFSTGTAGDIVVQTTFSVSQKGVLAR